MINEIKGFLTPEECKEIIRLIDENNQKSTVVIGGTKEVGYDSSRTSSTATLQDTGLVPLIKKRIATTLQLRVNQGEPIQGQLYNGGEYFRPHYDWFGAEAMETHGGRAGQRTHTLMIYLNDDFKGGETNFPTKQLAVKPELGKAVWWRNTKDDGSGDESVLHEGSDVVEGSKYIITAWFRERDYINSTPIPETQPLVINTEADIPQCTPLGFKKVKVPGETWKLILETYALLKDKEVDEQFQGKETIIQGSGNSTILSMDHLPTLRSVIHQQLHQLHQDWAGREIEPSFIYGIRSYKKGATLTMHKDRIETHHISSIILVDKDLRCGCQSKEFGDDWGLQIVDHEGTEHTVYLEPGEMVLYESAICNHGRKEPFQGTFFNNFFVHYKFK